jgi:hypothetical protein
MRRRSGKGEQRVVRMSRSGRRKRQGCGGGAGGLDPLRAGLKRARFLLTFWRDTGIWLLRHCDIAVCVNSPSDNFEEIVLKGEEVVVRLV